MITMLVVVVIFLLVVVGLLYFFKYKKERGTDRAKTKNGDEGGALDAISAWWKNKDTGAREWFWYIAIAIVAVTVSYTVSEELRYRVVGAIVLVGIHAVWLTYTDKTSKVTKIVITGLLGFYVVVFLLPDVVALRDAKLSVIKKAIAKEAKDAKIDDENYGKTPPASQMPQQGQATAPAVYQPETRKKKVTVTQNEFTEVQVPPGAFASFDCPYGAIARYYYTINGGPLQREDHDCIEPINIAELGPVSNFRIAFSSKTEVPQEIEYKITF